jgi:hypothetical protein
MNRKPVVVSRAQVSPAVEAPAIVKSIVDPVFTGEIGPTIIHPDFEGLNLITGFRGKGKTSYALKVDRPSNMCMLDYEDKGVTLVKKMGIGSYFQPITDVIRTFGRGANLQAIYDRTVQILEAIPIGRFTTLIIDNAQDLQDSSAQLIKNNPALAVKYGVRPENAISGGYGGAWPGVKHVIAEILHLANSRGIKVIVVTFQLKGAWKDGKPLFNKFKTTDVAIWHERSVLTLALVDPTAQYFPIPRALVMKESLSTMEWDEERKMTVQVRRLPPALPRAEPRFVYEYLDNPVDLGNLKPGEDVTASELSPLSPTFDKEQLSILERMARAQKELGIEEQEGE